MAKTSWYNPSAVFTNNDKLVTVANEGNTISNPSMYKNGFITAEGFTVEVDYVYYNGTTLTIVLHEGWPGGGGNFGIRMFPGAGAIAGTAMDLATLAQLYEELATSASATAVADSVGLRTSTGAFKVNDANNLDEAVNLGQLSDGAFGPDCTDFGLGLTISVEVDDWDEPRVSGFYKGSTSTTPNAPLSGSFNFAGLRIASFNANNGGLLTFENVNNRWFVNTHNGNALTGWQELYHSGNSVNPYTLGLGLETSLEIAGDCLTETVNGQIKRIDLTTANSPFNYGILRVNVYNTTNRVIEAYATASNEKATRRLLNNVWQDWEYYYHSGNSVNPLDYGVGGVNKLPDASSLQGSYENGFYYLPNATSRPSANAANWYLRVENVLNNSDFRKYTASPVNLINGSAAEYTCIRSSGVFSEWERNFTSANTNFNEFGGLSANDTIAVGASASGTFCAFYLPIPSKLAPSDITVSGTFKVRSPQSGTYYLTGVTPTISSSSTNKITVLTISGTGLPAGGSALELVTETATSKITVNF